MKLGPQIINHGFTMREAGQRVQPNLNRSTVASVFWILRNENRVERYPSSGGHRRVFSTEQEVAIVNMVLANNEMSLREVQTRVIQDHDIFNNINAVSLATINRVLHRHQVTVKQLYTVPFERNSDRVKEIRCRYVLRIMELEANSAPHMFIYVDEAGFNLSKVRRRVQIVVFGSCLWQVDTTAGKQDCHCWVSFFSSFKSTYFTDLRRNSREEKKTETLSLLSTCSRRLHLAESRNEVGGAGGALEPALQLDRVKLKEEQRGSPDYLR
ncbi:hypothetical protein SKAU_G00087380 [Synaphobranchus kaupii]|uniref:Transposase n=1 Tax=Synaphobranchus kaupii TaxID=118154 RepID=A0A9Q1FWV4_SYNKA|nr:hypothetical protein SKAU_G00087380 [Synaphobranchus kaupii]